MLRQNSFSISSNPSISHQHSISTSKTTASLKFSTTHFLDSPQKYLLISKSIPILKLSKIGRHKTPSFMEIPSTRVLVLTKRSLSAVKMVSCMRSSVNLHLLMGGFMEEVVSLPAFAAETDVSAEQVSDKINLESILISIDEFFNRYPFFVASLAFIWLVVIPLTQEYLKKYKFISAFDGYRKLKDDPDAQLLDIRKKQSLMYMGSPNLMSLKKNAVQVEFLEGNEDGFVKEVLKRFSDPGKTVLCIMDNFDGNTLEVAELLFKSGFKEAYAIKGGLRGKDGWQEIQETLLPPSLHVYPKKKKKKMSQQPDASQEQSHELDNENGQILSSKSIHQPENKEVDNGYIKPIEKAPQANLISRRLNSPYPNYPDMKPPSSPTPSKPTN